MSATRILLWSAPKCMSSAFERSIRTLRDVQVIHESFAVACHFGQERDDVFAETALFEANATYQAAVDALTKDYEGKRLIFAKEMAFCLKMKYDILLQEGMKEFKHTFLIRSPHQRVRSLIRNRGYFLAEEFGCSEQFDLYYFVANNLHPSPVVIDVDDLLEFPDETMRWLL
ncbi:hypothetical protein QZH41_004509 [Actinostola sp. cb2023]|nr:hypothetical protein QZH41_004509 [Actinostola sp. cb2023]